MGEDYFELLSKHQNDCKKSSHEDFAEEIEIFKKIMSLYCEAVTIVHDSYKITKMDSDLKISTSILSTRNFQFLQNAFDVIEKGYYEVGMTLIRNVYENNVLLFYLLKYPDEATFWLFGKKKYPQKYLRKKLNIRPKDYKFLSNRFAHPTEGMVAHPSMSFDDSTTSIGFHFLPEYDTEYTFVFHICNINAYDAFERYTMVFIKELNKNGFVMRMKKIQSKHLENLRKSLKNIPGT